MLARYSTTDIICGVDEAGRGCLAGPVVAGAVILPVGFKHDLLNDSKQVNEKDRDKLRQIIEEEAIDFAVGIVSHHEIDRINILQASFAAMHQAITKLKTKADLLLIDGNRFKPYNGIPHKTIIKGDATYLEIAAASILAKTYRDEIMMNLAIEFPAYHWDKNKGYPTPEHRDAIKKHGASPYHRMTFQLLKVEQLNLF